MSDNQKLGFWTDHLKDSEVNYSKEIAEHLEKNAPWAKNLLINKRTIRALEIQKGQKLTPNETIEIKSVLFEIRFAYFLCHIGLTAEYEYSTGRENYSVDFKLDTDPIWLIELTSLRESKAVKDRTHTDERDITHFLSVTNPYENAPEILDYIKVQNAIISKVCDKNGNPIKFPKPTKNCFNMIVIDMRSFIVSGGDKDDYIHIASGYQFVDSINRRIYINSNGKNGYIKGLFDKEHPNSDSKLIRERIHAIAFINEEKYTENEILDNIFIIFNPHFFKSNEEFKSKLPNPLNNLPCKKN